MKKFFDRLSKPKYLAASFASFVTAFQMAICDHIGVFLGDFFAGAVTFCAVEFWLDETEEERERKHRPAKFRLDGEDD